MARAYRVSPGTMSSPTSIHAYSSDAAGVPVDVTADGRPVLVVAGPTASGKSELATRLAEEFAGIVINADSMQVYRELSILTARPEAVDLARAPHRLYGVLSASEPCSAARWRDMALAEVSAAHEHVCVPILCGGTGLYIDALTRGISEIPDIPDAVRAEARRLHAEIGGPAFHARLADRDPVMATRLEPGNSQRLIRAWEVLEATGRSLAEWQAVPPVPPEGLRFFTILLAPERERLYRACDQRFDRMIATGAMDEIRALDALGLDPTLPAMKALGVPQLRAASRGEMSLADAVEIAKRETRRYAKRQMTWFRHQLAPDLVLGAQFSKSLEPEIFPKIRQFLLTE